MKRRIIIPAAGEAVRFGGTPKELLPISETDCALTHAIRLANSLDAEAVVVSNTSKAPLQMATISRAGLRAELAVRGNHEHKGLWGSIEFGLARCHGCAGGVILADSVAKLESTKIGAASFLQFGVFETREPQRFSVLLPDRIATNEASAPGNLAWGMVLWDEPVAEFLMNLEVQHYDRAFEQAMAAFRWETFRLAGYHDFGSFAAYKEFLVGGKSARELELEDLLVSARAIAQRKGRETAWERFDERVKKAGVGSITAKTFKVLPSDGGAEK